MKSSNAGLSLAIAAGAMWLGTGAVVGGNRVESSAFVAEASLASYQTPATQPAASPPTAKGNVENGKTLYVKYGCYACHGYAGHGGAGARLAPNPIVLPAFTRYVRRPTNVMPPYTEKVMTDQQLADIHAYLTTLPRPPDPATIPLLQDTEK